MKITARCSTPRPWRKCLGLVFLATLWALNACDRNQPAAVEISEAGDSSQVIAWYEGDVESAFDVAKTEGRPLFLYWGAEWCPPCHVLKNNIFSRPEFIARMRDFVPVYLDGDTARAQILGEQFEVKGYPTVIIFNPLGEEVMRMPSTVPVEQYEIVLDSAIATMKPVKTVLEEVLNSGPSSAPRSDLNLLAFYSWSQDSQVDLQIDEQVQAFERLHRETPAEFDIERSRFLGLYLTSLARQQRQEPGTSPLLTDSRRADLQAEIVRTQANPRLRNANMLWIVYYADSIIDLLQPEDSPDRQHLLAAWQQTANAIESDTSLSVGDRLNATRLKVELASLERKLAGGNDDEVPVALQDHVRRQASWAMETVTDESELQSVINTLAYLLESAGLNAEAETMLLARMNDTVAPYYFMSWIAGLKEDAGETEVAIEWHRQAYDAAKGRYSRFRWGSTYLRRLMDLAPDSAERIEADSVEVLSELLSHEDAFAGGNHARLDGLETAFWRWNEAGRHDDELARIRDFVHGSCASFPAAGEDSQRQRCETFLIPSQVEEDAAL